MSEEKRPHPRPAASPEAMAAQAARRQREAAALRENLKKRKQQSRARETAKSTPDRS